MIERRSKLEVWEALERQPSLPSSVRAKRLFRWLPYVSGQELCEWNDILFDAGGFECGHIAVSAFNGDHCPRISPCCHHQIHEKAAQLTSVQFLTLTADPIDLTIVVSQNGDRIVKTLPNKSPEAVFRVTLNMPAWITPDNPVINLEMVPIRGDVVLYDPEVLAPDRAEFWISGGTRGVTAVFGALAHLQDGQRYPQTIRIRLAD